jgi:hypothetical protein
VIERPILFSQSEVVVPANGPSALCRNPVADSSAQVAGWQSCMSQLSESGSSSTGNELPDSPIMPSRFPNNKDQPLGGDSATNMWTNHKAPIGANQEEKAK